MKLVKPQDLIKASPFIHYLGGEYFARILMHLLRFNKINDLYDKVSDVHGIDSINSLLEQLNVKIEIDEKDLKKLPPKGSFITVSNHPFGGIDPTSDNDALPPITTIWLATK